MATARDYIGRAMRLLGLKASGEVPTASEAADGLQAFNAMLNAMAIDGVDIGQAAYTLDDEVYVPKGYEKGLAYALAVEIAPEYGAEPSPRVQATAGEMIRLLRAVQADVDDMKVDRMLTFGNMRRYWGRTV